VGAGGSATGASASSSAATSSGIGGASAASTGADASGASSAATTTGSGGATAAAGVGGAATGTGGDASGAGGAATGAGGAASGTGGGGATGAGGSGGAPVTCTPATVDNGQVIGFATVGGTTDGGEGGSTVNVTSSSQLNDADDDSPRIYRIMNNISGDFEIGSNKTVVGASAGVTLSGSLLIDGQSNVIIQNLRIDASDADGDGIGIQGSDHIWIDHCEIFDAPDGNMDITNGSDYVTVSWNKFHYTANAPADGHRFSNLIGGSDNETDDRDHLRVTLYRNWWADGVIERMPRGRFGDIHLFNNYYSAQGNNYAVGAGIEVRMLLEGNFFNQVEDPHQIIDGNTTAEIVAPLNGPNANGYSVGSLLSTRDERGSAFTPSYSYELDPASCVQTIVTAGAGPR